MSLSKPTTSRFPNGLAKPSKVSRRAAGFRRASGFVAAIDFGTTYCSVAYTLQQDSKEILKLPIDGHHTRVPNAVLVERGKNTVEAFGYRAQTMFSQMRQKERFIYFERMKMILYHRKDVSRTTPVSPINSDEEYYLVDVVALILKYLRDTLYDCLRMNGIDNVQFDWVVTVPAIWDIRGKQMMREAAYKAGLCSSSPSCNLIPCSKSRKLERPIENAPDRLSLALEPEVAGLYCQNSGELHVKPRHFTVLDIGGGTVDITSYHVDREGRICVKDKANGNDWGGTRVNEQFSKFLQTVVDDRDFRQYLHVPDAQLQQQHKADLNKLIYESFEEQKIFFGDEDNDEKRNPAEIVLPKSFVKFYKEEKLEKAINEKHRDIAELDGNLLYVEPQKMKEFFQAAIEHISRYAFLALERVKQEVGKLEAIYLVGGFGGCKFVKKTIQDIMQGRYGQQLEVFVPVEHKVAVACGAIKFRRNPEIIWARKAELTYGDVVNSPFDPDIHDPAYKTKNEKGKDYCRGLFRPFMEIGDTIRADEVLQTGSVTPFRSSMTSMAFTIYSSTERNIWYARDKDGNIVSGLKEVGTLDFDLQDIPGEKDDKSVVLTVDLSQTEIQLKAHHEKTKKEVKVVLDCL